MELINLVEQIQVENYPAVLPLEIHIHVELDDDELNVTFNARIVLVSLEDKSVHPSPDIILKTTSSKKHRLRGRGLSIPAPGNYDLYWEWRHQGLANWNRDPEHWPLLAEVMK